jgi:hypothetical protein
LTETSSHLTASSAKRSATCKPFSLSWTLVSNSRTVAWASLSESSHWHQSAVLANVGASRTRVRRHLRTGIAEGCRTAALTPRRIDPDGVRAEYRLRDSQQAIVKL